jgi:hypothetical protein
MFIEYLLYVMQKYPYILYTICGQMKIFPQTCDYGRVHSQGQGELSCRWN